ncbi:MAG TPA: hypothetical protein VEC93_03390 [Anaerolineae bacterium]|nr:hypothetical protein [Anaerolineae bacterium]
MKKRGLNLIVRMVLFGLILSLGTIAALVTDEIKGLALADLSGTSIQALAATQKDVLYASLSGGSAPAGLYRSDDHGHTWQLVSSGPGLAINALGVHPSNDAVLYAGTAGGPLATANSVWRSDDGGQAWRKFSLSLPANPYRMVPAVTALAVDPHQPEVLYAGTDGQGVYRFDERRWGYELLGGISLYNAHVRSLVVSPDSRVYALTSEGLFVTAGDTWQEIKSLPERAISLAVAVSDPKTLYVGCPSSGAYHSKDGGHTWQPISDGLGLIPGAALRVTALVVDEQEAQHVVAATAYGLGSQLVGGGIYESHDSGHSWTKLGDAAGLVTHLIINERNLYGATTKGLIRYGEPAEPAPVISLPGLRRLAHPTGSQVLILILTLGLAGLALLGRVEWLTERHQSRA